MPEEQWIAKTAAVENWLSIGTTPHHGIAVPLFSLHSHSSGGIGEFFDLIPLIRWCHSLGIDVVQLLPLNDTGKDFSPYSSLSAFALNPLHLSLRALPHLSEDPVLSLMLKEIQKETQSSRINYPIIFGMREDLLTAYFKIWGHSLIQSESYQSFYEANHWLDTFALFKTLKTESGWSSCQDWPEDWKFSSLEKREKLEEQYRDQIAYHILIQFLCFQQMRQVKKIADELKVFLKGDIPILVNRESADVWANSTLFDISLSAGAPPDAYSKEGQNWGFPLYRWDEMSKKNYVWWKSRMAYASNFYHIYRIDHVVGFFRIWGIPFGSKGSQGFFVPTEESSWIPQGRSLMQMLLKSTLMLPIGEDLGTVPNEVKDCLKELGICGTKVMRWERKWDSDKSFIDPENYNPLSVTTVSTHDSETLSQWWKDMPEEARAYAHQQDFKYTTPLSIKYRKKILNKSHRSSSLFHINLLQEYLACFSDLVWDNPDDERINVPGTINERNWTYRFKPSLEEILSYSQLGKCMRDIVFGKL